MTMFWTRCVEAVVTVMLYVKVAECSSCSKITDTPGIYVNTRLFNHTYKVTHVRDVIHCVTSCLYQRVCSSVNYQKQTTRCELTHNESIIRSTELQPEWKGWAHIIAGSITINLGKCQTKPCPRSSYCQPISSGYQCIDAALCYEPTVTGLVKEYEGTHNLTISGRVCQRWDTDYPQHRINTPANISLDDFQTLQQHHNYCRKSIFIIPWCYTTDPKLRWENCTLPKC